MWEDSDYWDAYEALMPAPKPLELAPVGRLEHSFTGKPEPTGASPSPKPCVESSPAETKKRPVVSIEPEGWSRQSTSSSDMEIKPGLSSPVHKVVEPLRVQVPVVERPPEPATMQRAPSRGRTLKDQRCESKTCLEMEAEELQPGALLQVGGFTFNLGSPIGEGSFGTVWAAEEVSSGLSLVVKEILCVGSTALDAAKFEAAQLKALRTDRQDKAEDDPVVTALPFLHVAAIQTLSSDTWRALLVMRRLPGQALLDALEAGNLAPPAASRPEAHAFRLTRVLLEQMSPAMERVAARTYHRDAHAHNILVAAAGGKVRFGLVDFGLAVEAAPWRRGGWRLRGAAGDCRYWPTSAWLLFARGEEALSTSRHLRMEYETQLDLHSIGLTALQMLVELSREGGQATPLEQAMSALRQVWRTFWTDVSQRWSDILEAYNRDGHADSVKRQLSQTAAHAALAHRFELLRNGLFKVLTALQSPAQEDADCGLGALQIVEALLLMVSSGRPDSASAMATGASDPSAAAPPASVCWRRIQEVLAGPGKAAEFVEVSTCDETLPRDEEPGSPVSAEAASPKSGARMSRSSSAGFWEADAWDPDQRVYVGAGIGQTNHLEAVAPEDGKNQQHSHFGLNEENPTVDDAKQHRGYSMSEAAAREAADALRAAGLEPTADPDESSWDACHKATAELVLRRSRSQSFWQEQAAAEWSPCPDTLPRLDSGDSETLERQRAQWEESPQARRSDSSPNMLARAAEIAGAALQLEELEPGSDDEYWNADQWDADLRVYVGAEAGQNFHLLAVLPEDQPQPPR